MKKVSEAIQMLVANMQARLAYMRSRPLSEEDLKFQREELTPIEKCRHLKGGEMRRAKGSFHWFWDKFAGRTDLNFGKNLNQDYNISDHTFIDGSRVVKCLYCKKTWRPDQPGWEEAVSMVLKSTNSHSTSEVPIAAIEQRHAELRRAELHFAEMERTANRAR